MVEDELWKRRFHLFALIRLVGLIVFFVGVAIAFSDLVREGGWPLLGGLLAVSGALDAVLAPRVLKKIWEKQGR